MSNKKIIQCNYCKQYIERYISQIKQTNFCNIECKGKYQSDEKLITGKNNPMAGKTNTGVNNHNYGKRWNKQQRQVASHSQKQFYLEHPEIKEQFCSTNRGKKFSKELIEKMHKHRSSKSYSHPHSIESKELIGNKSAAKFTDEYKQRFKLKMIDKGLWRPDIEKSDYEIYFKASNWVERMFDRSSVDELALLAEHGVFNCRYNRVGVVRDHKFSRKAGFDLKVFPELIQHPANCQIILNSDNVKKRKKDIGYGYDNVWSLDDLFEAITSYSNKWENQDTCIELIKQYRGGNRWKR